MIGSPIAFINLKCISAHRLFLREFAGAVGEMGIPGAEDDPQVVVRRLHRALLDAAINQVRSPSYLQCVAPNNCWLAVRSVVHDRIALAESVRT